MISMRQDFEKLWRGCDPFEEAAKLQGEMFKEKDNRRTLRFFVDGQGFFLKYHEGVGWQEIIKNLLQLRLPILSAKNEYLAINRFRELGIETMVPVAFAVKGRNPAQLESFLITEELADTINLKEFSADWNVNKPHPAIKRRLIRKLANISRAMLGSGMNHRDFYLCHFLIHPQDWTHDSAKENPPCYVIDLHRVQIRDKVPPRWLLKDLSGLYFSAMDAGISQRDMFRFLKIYFDQPLKRVLDEQQDLLSNIQRNAEKMYLKKHKKKAPKIPL